MTKTRMEPPTLGAFVKLVTDPFRSYGIGKLTRLLGAQATVTYFDVPGQTELIEVQQHVSTLRVVTLPEQTRVFWLNEETGRWKVGRVIDGKGATILVAFPNGGTAHVPRADVRVRWRRPIQEPVAFLARYVTETPRFSEARSEFMRALTTQRAACRGMGALLSSSVQLVDYQFNVVQRVLQDPVQRYLLADEVGLGKTIEAGYLIRQYMLDFPATARAVVVVPGQLVQQWRRELRQKFNLGDWLDDFLHVIDANDLDTIEKHLPAAGMLVVDEAHHLSRRRGSKENPLYDLLRRYAPHLPRLILLSATPVLSDTAGFLRILHLLDPVVFRPDDLASFQRRLEARQLVAEVVASLSPENVFSMEDDLDRLEQSFHDDQALLHQVRTLRPIVQMGPSEEDEDFLASLSKLRAHLTETYKLHRRILRNRRKTVPWATPRRSGLDVFTYRCTHSGERSRALDDLRVHLINSDSIQPVVNGLFAAAVHVRRLQSIDAALEQARIDDPDARALAKRIDELTRSAARDGARLKALVQAVSRLLETPGMQAVVFCDRIESADRVAEVLRRVLASEVVQRHTPHEADADVEGDAEEPWRRFLTDPAHCRILVCDVRAEEGLNLHGGKKTAIHYDLPEAPNRFEQRLGRLDRFGDGNAVRSQAIVCADDATEQAWLECLNTGLQVFDSSIASLQYLVEETLRSAVTDWAGEGSDGLKRWCSQLAGADGWVARERRRIDQQDALDAMGDPHTDAFDELETVDGDWGSWRKAVEGFSAGALQFRIRPEEWSGTLPQHDKVFRFNYVRDSMHNTLFPLSTYVAEFLGTIDPDSRHSRAQSPLTHPYAYHRRTALSKEGQIRGVRTLRFGDPFIESLQSFCSEDDRGRIFAMWRHWPSYEARDSSGVDLFFRFDLVIEADVSEENVVADRALRRRAETHFPPQFHSIWVDAGGAEALEPPPTLVEPYRPKAGNNGSGRDYNLNADRWQQLRERSDIPWNNIWNHRCTEANSRARSFIETHNALREPIKNALRTLQIQHDARTANLTSRVARLTGASKESEMQELRSEKELYARLATAVRTPRIRTDVAGAVFVSAIVPF